MWQIFLRDNSHYILFVFISIFSLLLQYQAGDFKPIIFHDSPYPLDPLSLINKFSSVWRDNTNLGYFDPSGVFLSVFYILLSPVYFLTNNIVATQFFFLFTISNVSLITTYHLARYLGINKTFSILSAVLYLANPYSIFYVWRILNANIILYAIFPLILLTIFKIVRNENRKKFFVILILTEFISLPSFTNLAFYLSFLLVTLTFGFISSLSFNRPFTYNSLRHIILTNLIVLFILFVPILGYIFSSLEIPTRDLAQSEGAAIVYNNNLSHMDLASLFSLTGFPPLYEKIIWFGFEHIYISNFKNVVGLLIASVIFVFIALRITDKNAINKNIYPFIIVFIILSALLVKETGYALFHNFPLLLLAFRDPFHKFQIEFTLVLIILFSYCAQNIYEIKIIKRNKSLKLFLSGLVFIPIIYWILPFVSGNFVPTHVNINDQILSAFTDEPYRYAPGIEYLKQDKDIINGNARVLVYPLSDTLWCDAKAYLGNDILRFSGINTISSLSQTNSISQKDFLNKLQDYKFLQANNYTNTLSSLGIKYILIRKQPCELDLDQQATKSEQERINSDLGNFAKSIEGKIEKAAVKRVIENDYFSLYKITGEKNISEISVIYPNLTRDEKLKYINPSSNFVQSSNLQADNNTNLNVQLVFTGLQNATSMTVLGPNEILVLEKSNGVGNDTIKRIINNKILSMPSLNVNVTNQDSSEMSGIALTKNMIEHKKYEYRQYIHELSVLGRELGGIIDFQIAPDGNLYVLTSPGSIYRVIPLSFVKPQYQKISSNQYIINIKDIGKPFSIILSESYDKGWKAFIDGQQIIDKNHFIASSFANGWYINRTGSFNIQLYFEPQKFYDIGLIVYASSISFFLFYWLYSERNTIRRITKQYIR